MFRSLLILLPRLSRLLALLWLIAWSDHGILIQIQGQQPARSDESFSEFERDIWPLLTRGEGDSCVSCHDAENKSELHFFPEARANFPMLLEQGYFSEANPDSLRARVSSSNPKKRMPKGRAAKPWTQSEVQLLALLEAKLSNGSKPADRLDERFPSALLLPYTGPIPNSLDNQFISYRQLKGKVKLIFDDDWVRHGHDLFQANIALFGGADFKERFNESTKASATVLSGLDMLAAEVAAQAYTRKTGPFTDRPDENPSPLSMTEPDSACAQQISKLYQDILFRPPTPKEVQEAFALLQGVYRSGDHVAKSSFELSFQLTVADAETQRSSTQDISIPVGGEPLGLYQEFIDESVMGAEEPPPAEEKPTKRKERKVSGLIAKTKLGRTFHLHGLDPRQRLVLYNLNTIGNVSFAAIELRQVGIAETNPAVVLSATNALVQAEGGWKFEQRKSLSSFEDENNDKGNSSITVPFSLRDPGEYEVTVAWRQSPENARRVLVEVYSDDPSQLSAGPLPVLPPPGEAHYFIDESNDAVAFADLKTLFRFATNDYVEISNQGTHARVTADAVQFVSAQDQSSFLVDNDEAAGRENWKVYDSGDFKAYNQVGKDSYHDDNQRKGELFLRYAPSLKQAWKPDAWYQIHVGYPAKKDHEIHAPVVVKARQSSPLAQVAYPVHAQVGATVALDASRSYTVQGSALKFKWAQTGGPMVSVPDWTAPTLRFVVPQMSARQAAWTALCRALMGHPDFVFTRPPSVQAVSAGSTKRHLQLVKVAQDLLGRPPTAAERRKLDEGKSIPDLVDEYLRTQEFKDFYFHRIRLYLESQGTESQDEPARLWCYIAFHDRPFQEILTADYTVSANGEKHSRPAWHGRTGLLTSRGFIEGKPGLPHFNFAAQVAELFLGYVFEVQPEVIAQREGITAVSTTDASSVCYSCHKILTPLAFQRTRWDDAGRYRIHDDYGLPIDDSDQKLVASYPFAGEGLEAFASQAVRKERFIRTIINTHFTFFFGREMRSLEDERVLYKALWDEVHRDRFAIRGLIKALVTSPEYLEGRSGDN